MSRVAVELREPPVNDSEAPNARITGTMLSETAFRQQRVIDLFLRFAAMYGDFR